MSSLSRTEAQRASLYLEISVGRRPRGPPCILELFSRTEAQRASLYYTLSRTEAQRASLYPRSENSCKEASWPPSYCKEASGLRPTEFIY